MKIYNEIFDFLGSGKGAAMVACVAERSPLSKPLVNDEETIGYENMN
jgi:hypothetical protein